MKREYVKAYYTLDGSGLPEKLMKELIKENCITKKEDCESIYKSAFLSLASMALVFGTDTAIMIKDKDDKFLISCNKEIEDATEDVYIVLDEELVKSNFSIYRETDIRLLNGFYNMAFSNYKIRIKNANLLISIFQLSFKLLLQWLDDIASEDAENIIKSEGFFEAKSIKNSDGTINKYITFDPEIFNKIQEE